MPHASVATAYGLRSRVTATLQYSVWRGVNILSILSCSIPCADDIAALRRAEHRLCLFQSAEVEAATGGGHPNKEGPSWGAGDRSSGALSWQPGKRIPLPREIVAQLDESVVGQDDAKRVSTPTHSAYEAS